MTWPNGIRQTHRWTSMVFTLTVIANFIALGMRHGAPPPAAITYSPLAPLSVLLFTGLYMFVQPYATRWRNR